MIDNKSQLLELTQKRNVFKYIINKVGIYILVLIYVILVYALINPLLIESTTIVQTISAIIMILVMIFGAIFIYIDYKKKGKVDYTKVIIVLIILGSVLRTSYITVTSYTERQHDVGSWESNFSGHAEYIKQIYENGKLPENNEYQYYQPPLQHMIEASFLRVSNIVGVDFNRSLEGMQIVTLTYSILLMIVCYKLLKEMKVKGIYSILVMLIMCFHPQFIILSGSINNDLLVLLLMFIVMLYAFRWHKETNIKNTVIMAIAMGLCVMTKISGALVAVPVIFVFLDKFIHNVKKDGIGKYIVIFAIFGAISLSIGLWYPIRNYIKFEQPLSYVYEISEDNELYSGDYSITDRFFSMPQNELSRVYCEPFGDYSVPLYLLKSSIFGEYKFPERVMIVACLQFIVNIVLIIISIIAMIRVIIFYRNKESYLFKWFMLILWLVQIVSFIAFNIRYPFGCTMDFRYMVPTLFTGAIFMAMDINNIKNEKVKDVYITVTFTVTIIFCLFATLIFNAI